MTLVDTNVLLDVVTDDPVFAPWSLAQLEAAALVGPLIINGVIYAELSVRYASKERLDAFITGAGLKIAPIPEAALFLAGKVFAQYRRAGGAKTGVLPDFFIGAHAAVGRYPILTRDTGRYRSYFPTVTLVTPQPGQMHRD
ncbi:type II toxin-antitoxin system VapC family toxin [Oceaniglobus ichthyenteri]|uniref:type II toxin-antitoxin system VapC family toxin n=1 Tax=Oceaniglobus ichthyenteri TaxID=2136177 RepID=UPI000D3D2F51|nr:type II toxin-antitoxin system VapC family toxin [Oceaniglobus ichthyenteri]